MLHKFGPMVWLECKSVHIIAQVDVATWFTTYQQTLSMPKERLLWAVPFLRTLNLFKPEINYKNISGEVGSANNLEGERDTDCEGISFFRPWAPQHCSLHAMLDLLLVLLNMLGLKSAFYSLLQNPKKFRISDLFNVCSTTGSNIFFLFY